MTYKENRAARFMVATLASTFFSVGTAYLSIYYFGEYGWVLFVFSPFLIGLLTTAFYGKDTKTRVFSAVFFALLFSGLGLLTFAFEGVVCLAMAFPLAFGLAALGSLCGMFLWRFEKDYVQVLPLLLILLTPFLLSFEASNKNQPVVHKIVSTVEINAPVEKVWQNVVAFPQIEKQPEGILRLGFAYPINARIEGAGAGAIRYCNFNTGAFVEPVTVWQEPYLLAFDVREQPAPMIETSFYENLHPAHLDYVKSRRGQFRLFEKDGKTVVEGTTFYTHDIAPDYYWKLFSDEIIHRIHLRVLNHIKEVSEK